VSALPETSNTSVDSPLDRAFAAMEQARGAFVREFIPREIGRVTRVANGIAHVSGLSGVGSDELLQFPDGLHGIAFNVDEHELGVVLLGDYWNLQAGDEVQRTQRVMDVGVGPALLGRVIDPLGRALDGGAPVQTTQRLPIERPAAAILDRATVDVPLQTGLKVIDALIPIGRGQRELILGDRQTGKTAIAIDAILNQRDQNVICVYCAIGQRASAVAKAVATLRERGAMDYTVVVVTEGNQAPGLAFITSYAATSIAEHFMEAGRDVVAEHAIQTLAALPGTPRIWAVGERVQTRLADAGFTIAGHYPLPGSIDAVASLVGQIQIDSDADREQGRYTRVYLFHNRPTSGSLYEPVTQRLLPLDALWQQRLAALPWPRSRLPEILGGGAMTLRALVREYLFITLFRSCAESLASENASRLAAMERADSTIRDLVEQLDGRFRHLRQSSIDEELFDVLSGYEALSGEHTAKVSRAARSAP